MRVYSGFLRQVVMMAVLAAACGTAQAASSEQIDLTAGHLQLLLGVNNGHVTQLHFGPAGFVAPPAVAPTGKRKPPAPEDYYPAGGDGYIWEPALMVAHADGNTSTDLLFVKQSSKKIDDNVNETRVELKDPQYPFFVTLCFRTYAAESVLEQWTEIHHEESGSITFQRFASAAPTFAGAANCYLTQFSGKYKREMTPYEEKLGPGMKVLDSKLGTRGQYYVSPSFFLAPHGPAGEESGEVFGGTLAWSGTFQLAFEIQTESNRLRALCGMNPYDSAYRLRPGQLFKTPAMLWSYSSAGKGQISRNFHRWARAYGVRNAGTPRPVLLNNWEATHTKFDENVLVSLFDGAKTVGAECFLLDDGWFGVKHPRDNDRAGLGDWQPDPKKLPHGVEFLVDRAKERGLRFGIWVEPEMVNPESDLFEKHPDWAIQQPKRELNLSRNQLVLDLTRPEVSDFVFHAVDDLLTQNPGVSYIKWDCNRYITQPGSMYLGKDDQQNLWIDYNRALYDIMRRIASNHPSVQMMVCAGGGGRVDYGVLPYFDTFWPSDNTDPVARIKIQYGFSQFFPAVATADHVTRMGNRPLKFTFDVAMSGMLGMDMDLAKLSPEDLRFAAAAVQTYKGFRDVIANGDLYRLEFPYAPDGSSSERTALMYVMPDASKAMLFVYQTKKSTPKALVLQGLDAGKRYQLRELNLAAGSVSTFDLNEKTMDGAALMKGGVMPPTGATYDSAVIELTAESARAN